MSLSAGLAAIALVAVVAPAPRQADPLAELQAKVDAAAKQMEGDPQGTAESLDHLAVDSIELRKTRPLTPAEREVHARVFLLRGRTHLQLLSNAKAEESFRELLRVSPTFSGELSPLEQQVVDGLRQREGGVIEVTSALRDARVLVDGLDVGATGDAPVKIPLIAGSYEVRVEKPRFKPGIGRVTVLAGQTATVADLTPVRNVPPLLLLSDRDEVDVTADTVSVGRMVKMATLRAQMSPAESAALDRALASANLDPQAAAGVVLRQPVVDRSMALRFHRSCFVDAERPIMLTAEALDKLDPTDPVIWFGEPSVLRLLPDVGTVRIGSTPSDADVLLDGQLVGRTPFEREVCAGVHRIRIRHRIGSHNIAATITRGRTEAIDVSLKPDLAFLGAIDSTGRPLPDLTASVDRSLAATVTSLHLAGRLEAPPETSPWTDALTAQLSAASDRNDRDAIARLLKQASTNYDAPLLLCAVRRAGVGDAAVDLLLFWNEHAGVDRITAAGTTDRQLAVAIQQIDAPSDVADLMARPDIGLRVADTGVTTAPLLVVAVHPGSLAAAAGVKSGDAIEAVDRGPSTAAELAEKVANRKPGDLIALRVASPGASAREVSVAVQQTFWRVPAFDTTRSGNAFIAKLTAKGLVATTPAQRDLVAFNLALVHMRFGEWRKALVLLTALTNVPEGAGVGPGNAKYLAARCHEELGERELAVALYTEAAAANSEAATDDGATVASLATYRLATLAGAR